MWERIEIRMFEELMSLVAVVTIVRGHAVAAIKPEGRE